MRNLYPWPGSNSYSIAEMFECVEDLIAFASEHGIKQVSNRTEVMKDFVETAEKLPVVKRRHSFSDAGAASRAEAPRTGKDEAAMALVEASHRTLSCHQVLTSLGVPYENLPAWVFYRWVPDY